MEIEETKDKTIVYKDRIYGMIRWPPFLKKFIDRPEFQRLRDIKQCGTVSFVFPGGNHSRFEHCIGVAYLALRMISIIDDTYPELNVTQKEIEAVTIGGLLHDIGHGPFSHLFEEIVEDVFGIKNYSHEERGCEIIRKKMRDLFETEEDMELVINIIKGEIPKEYSNRKFLFQIVCNQTNGIDVDKMDYFKRDSHCCNVQLSCDIDILSKHFDIFEGEIAYREKYYSQVYEFLHTRSVLHSTVYNRKAVWEINFMIKYIFVELTNSGDLTKEDVMNIDKFLDLDDSLYKKKKDSIFYKRLFNRDLIKTIFQTSFDYFQHPIEFSENVRNTLVDLFKMGDDYKKQKIEFNNTNILNLEYPRFIIAIKKIGKTSKDYGMEKVKFIKFCPFTKKDVLCKRYSVMVPSDLHVYVLRVLLIDKKDYETFGNDIMRLLNLDSSIIY